MTALSTHDRDKVLALLKSLGAPCETKGKSVDHAWRKCRHCLAQQEADHEDIRALIRQFVVDAEAALRACAEAPDPESERLIEHMVNRFLGSAIGRLVEQWRERAASNGAIYGQGLLECADELEAALRACAEAPSPEKSDTNVLTVVVNGQPVEVNSGSVPAVIQQAILKSGQIGAPVEQWELRTRDGEIIPHDLDPDWELTGGRLLFLNLGAPRSAIWRRQGDRQ